MFEQVGLGFRIVLPIFALIALGSFIRRLNVIPSESFRGLNQLVYSLFLPANIVYSIATADKSRLMNPVLALMVFVSLSLIFFLGMTLLPRLVKEPLKRGVIVQALVRGNFVILGFPILTRLYGPAGLEQIGLILIVSMPIYNITGVWALEGLKGNPVPAGEMARKIITNPMIVATILGLVALWLPLPEVVMSTIQLLASASGTVALICLGGLLAGKDFRSNLTSLAVVSFIRLVLVPAVLLLIGYHLQFDERSLMTLLVFFGAPVAVITFAMVQRFGGDEDLAGQLIVSTTALSLFSYAFWIGLIKFIYLG